MQVRFIGLGAMGDAMANNLLKAGFALTVYNRSRAKAEAFVAKGAALAKTLAEATEGEVVITMLAHNAAVESAVFPRDGVLKALNPSAIHTSMSTISVALAQRLSDAHRAKKQGFVSAPVFGRPEAAAVAKLLDIRLALAAAEALKVPMPLASLIATRLLTLIAQGQGHLDWAALAKLAAQEAGLGLASPEPVAAGQ